MNKRNAQGSGSIRQRSDGTWEGRYTIPGTKKRPSVYGKTKQEVAKKLRAAVASVDTGIHIEPNKMKVGEWLDIWLDEYCRDVKPLTLKAYENHIKNKLKPSLGAVKLQALNAHEIQAFYNKLQISTEDKPGLAPKTIKNLHGVLHKAMQQAVEIGYLKFNPSGACKLPRIEKVEIQPFDDADIKAFLKAIKGHQFETLFIVDLFTGMRQGEILGLTWDCIDFQNGTIFIYRQLQKIKGVYKFESLKNNKTRTITPAPSVMKALQEHRRVQMEWRIMAGAAWDASNLVFTNQLGGHLCHLTVYNNFKRVVKSIGLPDARFHDLRHSYAVAALQNGDDIKVVQQTLGHHTAAFTLDTYGHVTEKAKKDSAKRMEKYYKGVTNQ